MKKLKIYLDTSVISHLSAPDTPDKMLVTKMLWQEILTNWYLITLNVDRRGGLTMLDIKKPVISQEFTLDDIKKIRDYNSSKHLFMTSTERKIESEKTISQFRDEMKLRFGKEIIVLK